MSKAGLGRLRAGELLIVDARASIQFSAQPMLFRVIRVHEWSTYDGWAWLDGYQLNTAGDAIERRSIFVQLNGLQPGRTELLGPQSSPRVAAAQGRPTR